MSTKPKKKRRKETENREQKAHMSKESFRGGDAEAETGGDEDCSEAPSTWRGSGG